MAKANRPPSHTAQQKLAAMRDAMAGELQPPAHMRLVAEDLEFWGDIVRARAVSEWRGVDMVVAAQLAHCQACIRRESEHLRAEGTVVMNERGTMVANPRCSILESLARREMAMMRTLQLTGSKIADPRNNAGARKNEQDARNALRRRDEDDDGDTPPAGMLLS